MVLTSVEIITLKMRGYTCEETIKRALRHMGLSKVVNGKAKVTREQAIAIDQVTSEIKAWY